MAAANNRLERTAMGSAGALGASASGRFIVRWQLVAPREVQEQMNALLDSLCAQRAVGPLWIVGRSRVTVTRFSFTFVARR